MDEATPADTSPDEGTEPEVKDFSLTKALSFANLAKGMDDTELAKIGQDVVDGFENDDSSRNEWLKRNEMYMKLATQVMERKTFPWDGAANVKYPLLTTAALQFASRAYSSLVPSMDVVKCKVIGNDQDGQTTELANKLSTHLSYTVMNKVEDWEENMDKLCFVLPIVGTMFKKIYWSDQHHELRSELLSPKDVVVHYHAKKLKNAARITHVQWYSVNEITEKQNREEWLKFAEPFQPGVNVDTTLSQDKTTGSKPPTPDDETPRCFLEQCCRIDLDDDGYKEPYIVTVDKDTKKVVRIVANFYPDLIQWKDDTKKKVECIEPAEWYVKYDFLPNPDGGFYGIGFGILLGGLNDMVNTITNQLIDAGTLSNLQAGFIGRGLRDNKQKKMEFRPGEWKWVNNPGKDLKENVFPLPVREPSTTLFSLLGTLVDSGKEVASVAEIFTGKMPGQNTPASTTMATIEQGLKVFTSIYKRIYRSMGLEFNVMFRLLSLYMPTDTINVVGEMNGIKQDYNVSRFDYQKQEGLKIIPAADPNMVSETQKLLKIQGLYELVQLGTINKQEMTRQALMYQGQENIKKLMELPPPSPPMEIQLKSMELQDKDKDRQLKMMELMGETQKMRSEVALNLAKAKQLGDEAGVIQLEMQLQKQEAQLEMQLKLMELFFKREEHKMEMKHDQEKHQMDMKVSETEAQMNLAMTAATNKQDVAFNEQKNAKQLDQMDSKHQMQMKQSKEKQNAKQGSVG